MKKGIVFGLLFICGVSWLVYVLETTEIENLADDAAMALFGFALLAITFFLKRREKGY